MSSVEVVVAGPQQRVVFENLMQLYTHDFSEHWYDRSTGEVDESGRFPDYPLDAYWREPEHIPLLLRHDSHIVGFALEGAWKVLLASLILGAGLPTLFALGIRSLAYGASCGCYGEGAMAEAKPY